MYRFVYSLSPRMRVCEQETRVSYPHLKCLSLSGLGIGHNIGVAIRRSFGRRICLWKSFWCEYKLCAKSAPE